MPALYGRACVSLGGAVPFNAFLFPVGDRFGDEVSKINGRPGRPDEDFRVVGGHDQGFLDFG